MGKHTDGDGDGVADYADFVRPADGDHDLGVQHVRGTYFHQIEVVPGFGRHVLHDERSREYDAANGLVADVTKIVTTMHHRVIDPWDQGQIGDCTANAALGLMMTEPFADLVKRTFTEDDCVRFYEQETQLDDRQIPGHYPPDDTGSTGVWSMKVLKAWGLASGYQHAFDTWTLQRILQKFPVSVGVPWYASMDSPDENGLLHVEPASGLRGGHQFDLVGIDVENQWYTAVNSWGTGWALKGEMRIPFNDFHTLLQHHGDVSVPVVS
jgi:hypothetical protein